MSDTREPFEWVEIEQDFCSRTYGSAPCTASLATGSTECYNTRSTCQDPSNYDRSVRVLRFCKNQAFLPDDGNYYMPTLVSASLSAGSINPVGASSNSSALGTRGGLSVRLQDGPHTDRYVDPYIANRVSRDAGYIATERGTFWSKWRARNPYYLGRVMRHKIGFIEEGAVVDVVTRTYFITGFSGPDGSGGVSFTAKDILSQFANEKSKVPAPSAGKLLNDLDTAHTHITLDPVGIIAEYPASGVIRIGSSLCDYTKTGPLHPDRLDIVRGQYGSTANNAKAGDIVQLCKVYSAQTPAAILEDLLTNYANIPAGYLDTAQWAQEQTDYLPRVYGTIISEPTGVQEIIAEMCEQMYFYLIWDERNALLKLRAIRPAQDDTVYDLSDFTNFVSDSVGLADLNDQLYTQVWVYYGLINYAASAKEEKNYAVREIVATDEGSADKQDLERIKKIYCRWIPSANGAAAIDLGEKMIARYGAAPRQVSFSLTGKDSDIWIGDFVQVSHRLSVDATGAPLPLNIQVMSAQESRAGTEFRYIGQEFVYEAPVSSLDRPIDIAADQRDFDLRAFHDSQYSPPTGSERINVTIRSGVVIGSSSTSAPAFDIGAWPSGVEIVITNYGIISGKGGRGGTGGYDDQAYFSVINPTVGAIGGTALKAARPVTINNAGKIQGGGGGGGGGAAVCWDGYNNPSYGGSGGGGAGDAPSLGGLKYGDNEAQRGSGGALTSGGIGGYGRATAPIPAWGSAGKGGNGGDPGSAGLAGVSAGHIPGAAGGAPGKSVDGNSFITWINAGIRLGPVT